MSSGDTTRAAISPTISKSLPELRSKKTSPRFNRHLSELIQLRSKGLVVGSVEPDSPASRAGFVPHDVIRRVEGREVNDIIDFRFLSSEESFDVEFVRNGIYETVQVTRQWGEDLGFRFTFELADQIHTCDNKCVFCFIHQMPKGMRKSLYLMDDDFRLSFLHGNYVTLTNISEQEFERIKSQGLSPLYVSVHATDPRLRGFMLGRGAPEPIVPKLCELFDAGISVHCQVVVCPGLNDGNALDTTIGELAQLHTAKTGKRAGALSVAVVPVGLTQFRHNLYPIRQVTTDYARAFLAQISWWHGRLSKALGTRFVFPTDEWFFYAKKAIPSRKYYEDFPQFEDGVGTCRMFLDEFARNARRLPKRLQTLTKLNLVTGALPAGIIERFAARLSQVANFDVQVIVVENKFFGPGITIAGLITATDLIGTIKTARPEGIVAVPDIAVKDGQLFLDDQTVSEVRQQTQCDVRICPSSAKRFIREWLPDNVVSWARRNEGSKRQPAHNR